eukprot:GEZU01020158.1.p1 GENE.GEZU01020158.1~~GEZU01020158.1.p1  ORF type:complete len:315 (+),score=98.00 GEZU01020158.1:164-1108(+)
MVISGQQKQLSNALDKLSKGGAGADSLVQFSLDVSPLISMLQQFLTVTTEQAQAIEALQQAQQNTNATIARMQLEIDELQAQLQEERNRGEDTSRVAISAVDMCKKNAEEIRQVRQSVAKTNEDMQQQKTELTNSFTETVARNRKQIEDVMNSRFEHATNEMNHLIEETQTEFREKHTDVCNDLTTTALKINSSIDEVKRKHREHEVSQKQETKVLREHLDKIKKEMESGFDAMVKSIEKEHARSQAQNEYANKRISALYQALCLSYPDIEKLQKRIEDSGDSEEASSTGFSSNDNNNSNSVQQRRQLGRFRQL